MEMRLKAEGKAGEWTLTEHYPVEFVNKGYVNIEGFLTATHVVDSRALTNRLKVFPT